MTKKEKATYDNVVAALADLMEQLEGVGIYAPGEDSGQWADVSGLTFKQAEAALAEANDNNEATE